MASAEIEIFLFEKKIENRKRSIDPQYAAKQQLKRFRFLEKFWSLWLQRNENGLKQNHTLNGWRSSIRCGGKSKDGKCKWDVKVEWPNTVDIWWRLCRRYPKKSFVENRKLCSSCLFMCRVSGRIVCYGLFSFEQVLCQRRWRWPGQNTTKTKNSFWNFFGKWKISRTKFILVVCSRFVDNVAITWS